MDLNGIAKAYQLVYEKKADKDYDGDGKIESGTAEYMGSKDKAIKKAMGKKVKHDCSSKVKHEEYGIGDCIKEMHTLDAAGNITHYDVKFEHGIEKNVFVGDLSVLVSEMHEHVINTDKNKEVLGNKDLMSAYYSMYEHHKKDADGNTIPHEDEIEEEVEQLNELSPDTLKSYIKKSQDQVKKRKKGIEKAADQAAEKEVLGRTVKKPKGFYDEEIDLSFVDELSEEELDELVEGVVYDLVDEGIEIDAIENAFTEYLDEAVELTEVSDKYYDSAVKMSKAAGKAREKREKAEARAKASKEKAEKFKKAVSKTVTGMKAKMHGGMADYAGKRGLVPTKAAAAAKKPTKVYKSKKYKTPDGEAKYAAAKSKEAQDLKKYNKVKDKKQSSGNIKVSMMGGGAKDTRSKLRSAVFKDVKDRVGKKTKAVIDAPTKVGQGIRSLVGKGKRKIGRSLEGLGKKMQEQGGELDMFDTVTAYLIDEEFAKDFDHAQRIMVTLDSSLIEEVHAEQLQILKEYGAPYTVTRSDIKGNTPAAQGLKSGKKNVKTGEPLYKAADHLKPEEIKNESLEDAYLKVYEGYDKPDEKLGRVTSGDANIPQKERDAANERILAKAKAKREKNK